LKKTVIQPPDVAAPVAPYSTAIRVQAAGGLLFVAGVVSCDVFGTLVNGGDILGQTRQIIKNLTSIVHEAGCTPESVVKTTTYVASDAMKAFFATNAFREFLGAFNSPADTLVGVASLVGSEQGQLIEIDAIAVLE
jgi:2-iminobutanoate/2-iminopropanoate deaminase